jgi:hypothetical protein
MTHPPVTPLVIHALRDGKLTDEQIQFIGEAIEDLSLLIDIEHEGGDALEKCWQHGNYRIANFVADQRTGAFDWLDVAKRYLHLLCNTLRRDFNSEKALSKAEYDALVSYCENFDTRDPE